jgi:lactoylglutathione lyase
MTALGYALLYVKDVDASLSFYEKAFGLARHVFHDDAGKAYGDLETGATRLGFVSHALAAATMGAAEKDVAEGQGRFGFEIALTTEDVHALYARAIEAGAVPVAEPARMPWGQTVAYVRDNGGFLVEICTPMG